MVSAFRRDAADPRLPFVQVQINRYTAFPLETMLEADQNWTTVRELQRTLSKHIPFLDTVSTAGYTLADGIHLDGDSQRRLGISAAESMFHLCFDPEGVSSLPAPKVKNIFTRNVPHMFRRAIAVKFENVHGSLCSTGAPWGFSLSDSADCAFQSRHVFRTELHEDTVYLYHELSDEKLSSMYLSYFYGNGTYANITDGAGRPLPAFGPLKLSDYLQ